MIKTGLKKIKTEWSLSLVQQKGNFFIVEVHKSIFFVHGMTPKVISQENMPILTVVVVQIFLQMFSNLWLMISVLWDHPYQEQAFDHSQAFLIIWWYPPQCHQGSPVAKELQHRTLFCTLAYFRFMEYRMCLS